MKRYWLAWFILPESIAIARDRVGDTLSGAVWQLENVVPGRDEWPWQWTAAHMLFTSCFIVLAIWLIGHFGWGIWR